MKYWLGMAFAVLSVSFAFAGEKALGGVFYIQGTVDAVEIRNTDVFMVAVRDPDDGVTIWSWMSGNKNALATLLSAKASGGTVRVLYNHMDATNTDRNVNCWDVPYERWVCNAAAWVTGY
jgi:hypothetical protein